MEGAWRMSSGEGSSVLLPWPLTVCQGALVSHLGESGKQGSRRPKFCPVWLLLTLAGTGVPRTALPCIWNEEFHVPIHSFHWSLSTCQGALDNVLAPCTAMNEVAWLLIPSEHRVSRKQGTKEKIVKISRKFPNGKHRTSGPWAGAPHYPECTGQHSHLRDQMHH